jgi:SRSO17 transposase
VVCAPPVTTLPEVVGVAGSRWTSESGVEAATGAVGLDHDALRSWTGWDRHLTRAMWALALLTSRRAGTLAVEA